MSLFQYILSILLLWSFLYANANKLQTPNFVVIFADDMGYGDLQSYGHPSQEKGPIDEMAEQGMRFTHWYSGDSLCTPSRAALLTGRLPIRSGMVGQNRVLWQWDSGGLPKSELTIAESLSKLGYSTGMVGKWHLGINENVVNDGKHLPFYHGFEYVGTTFPYGQHWRCDSKKFSIDEMSVKCFKYKNMTMVQQPTHMKDTTREIVEDAKTFFKNNRHRPFFFYMPLLQTHSSLFCSDAICGRSKRGPYGDSINEMAWAVGEVLSTLKEFEIEEKTLVLFLSDHGPQLELCGEGGSAGILKGGKASTWEGGLRVPAIAWWPGTIPAGVVSSTVVSTMDIFPTLLELAGEQTSEPVPVQDGKSITAVLTNQSMSSPHDMLFQYCSDRLMAVRYKSFKVHFHTQDATINPIEYCTDGKPRDDLLTFLSCYGDGVHTHDPPLIFDVDVDPGENYPLAAENHQNMLAKIFTAVEEHKSSIRHVPSQLGKANPELQPCCDPPNCFCNYELSKNGKYKVEL